MRVCAKAIERVDFRRAKFGVVEVQREGCGGRPLDFLMIALDHADDVGQITAEQVVFELVTNDGFLG